MPLREHLIELRRRIIWSLIFIALASIAGWYLYVPLTDAMTAPLQKLADEDTTIALNFATIGAAFDIRLRISFLIGVFISAPLWIGQFWAFIAPALTRREKFLSLSYTLSAAVLFIGGGLLGWWIMPRAIEVLTSLTPHQAVNLFEARAYFHFFTQVVLWLGVAFLLPVLMVGMNHMGVVRGKTFLKGWRWAVLACFVFAAMVNPLPDPWSMIAMALPITSLYFGAIGICVLRDYLRDRKAKKKGICAPGAELPNASAQT